MSDTGTASPLEVSLSFTGPTSINSINSTLNLIIVKRDDKIQSRVNREIYIIQNKDQLFVKRKYGKKDFHNDEIKTSVKWG